MKRMVLIPEEKLLQYEQQQRGLTDAQDRKEHDVPSEQGEERKELSDDVIVRGIPKTMRTRAIALLERLKARPDVISWDDMGQVKIDGTLIPKSNISDLVSSAMRSRKHFEPVALREFFGVLGNLNVPRDLVRNEEGWKRVMQKGEGEDWAGLWDFMKPIVTSRKKRGKVFRTMGRQLKTYGQKGKGDLISPGAWYQMGETEQKGLGRRKRSQEGGFTFGPYTQGLSGIEKKRRAPQKLRKIPNWEHYKG